MSIEWPGFARRRAIRGIPLYHPLDYKCYQTSRGSLQDFCMCMQCTNFQSHLGGFLRPMASSDTFLKLSWQTIFYPTTYDHPGSPQELCITKVTYTDNCRTACFHCRFIVVVLLRIFPEPDAADPEFWIAYIKRQNSKNNCWLGTIMFSANQAFGHPNDNLAGAPAQ